MQNFFQIDPRLESLSQRVRSYIKPALERVEEITEYNQLKVLSAFIREGVSETHFNQSTGYGYDDMGRDKMEKIFARIVGAEDSLIRYNFVSGTHTLAVALFGVLRPGDRVLCISGTPYDTIHSVFGIKKAAGSLAEFGVVYDQIDLLPDGTFDFEKIADYLSKNKVKMVYIQRSRGYSLRKSFSVEEIKKAVEVVRNVQSDAIIMADNCYGEFVEKTEPTQIGVDLMAGSLIKNAGGGIAKTGGYIAGRRDLVELCSYRLTTPGTGRELGATLGHNRDIYLGVFNAPHAVGEALKSAIFASAFFEELGYNVTPRFDEPRADIIQSIQLKNEPSLIDFCRGIQNASPVDSFAAPEPSEMPGYPCKIIMAAGTFTLGASLELSADAPLREPFAVWMQGGLNFHSAMMGTLSAAQEMLNNGTLKF